MSILPDILDWVSNFDTVLYFFERCEGGQILLGTSLMLDYGQKQNFLQPPIKEEITLRLFFKLLFHFIFPVDFERCCIPNFSENRSIVGAI
jgi:hypothetical protein